MKIFNKVLVAVLVITFTLGLPGPSPLVAATTVSLGAADDFAILAGSGITIGGAVNTSTITGDIGTFPTVSITGIGNAVLNGINHAGDAVTQQAKTDLATAYTAAGQPATTIPTELGGTTKFAGVYDSLSGTFGITGTLTLDAQGDPNAVFIFRTVETLVTAEASSIDLIDGAQACNVFWQIGSSATLGASSFFKGNILALTSIGLGTTANVEGRVLAQNGAVTLDGSNIITKATCIPAPSSSHRRTPQEPTPLIDFTKVPNPLSLPSGPGSVAYTYTATNIGETAVRNVVVEDNKCNPVEFISGDSNNDSILDVNETWVYRCTETVSETVTNTASLRAISDNWSGYDTASATVIVGVPLTPPLIHLVKKPSVFVLPAGGGAATYTYTVTNPGTEPLSNVSIIDNKCTGLPGRVSGHPGDLNQNNLLESNEVWTFTCRTNLTQTTTNTGTAQGSANGLTAIDFSIATVVVSPVVTPSLPSTGFAPEGKITPWNIAILAGLLAVSIFFYSTRRKQTA